MGFKVGDVVVCVKQAYPEDKDYPLVVGHTYKVISTQSQWEASVEVNGLTGYWSAWQFAPLVMENV